MKTCFIAIILLSCSFRSQSRYMYAGINGGIGILPNFNVESFFPDAEVCGSAGIGFGYMLTKHIGLTTGAAESFYSFNVYNDRNLASGQSYSGKQSLRYFDIPLCLRFVFGTKRKTQFYLEPGITIGIIEHAHFTNESKSTPATFETDDKDAINTASVRPILNAGFNWKLAKATYFNLGWEFSAAGQNVIKTENDELLANNSMTLGYVKLMIGVQFHFANN